MYVCMCVCAYVCVYVCADKQGCMPECVADLAGYILEDCPYLRLCGLMCAGLNPKLPSNLNTPAQPPAQPPAAREAFPSIHEFPVCVLFGPVCVCACACACACVCSCTCMLYLILKCAASSNSTRIEHDPLEYNLCTSCIIKLLV